MLPQSFSDKESIRRTYMSSRPSSIAELRAAATISHLIDELIEPLESATNLLYLIRAFDSDAESRTRFATVAQDRLQEIAKIIRRYDPASRSSAF
jgi:hypothetical protein